MSMSVVSKVTIYETDGNESSGLNFPELLVESHWNRSEMVVIRVGKHQCVTVLASDLQAAIRNATNAGRP